MQGSGFVLSQQAYAEELLRLNNVKPTALGKIPCPRDLACFDTLLADESPTEETVRVAQRLTGEISVVEPSHQTRSRIHRLSSCKFEHKGPGTCYPRCRASVSIHPAHQGLCSHRGSG